MQATFMRSFSGPNVAHLSACAHTCLRLPVRACLPRFAWRRQVRTQTGPKDRQAVDRSPTFKGLSPTLKGHIPDEIPGIGPLRSLLQVNILHEAYLPYATHGGICLQQIFALLSQSRL